MKALQVIALFAIAAAIAYAGVWYIGGFGMKGAERPSYIINDIYSLVIIPDDKGGCEAAVGYREKHVIGTLIATPSKELVCARYYFVDRPEDVFEGAPVVLVELGNGEHHWILQSQLIVEMES
jgi:hypothetical protein